MEHFNPLVLQATMLRPYACGRITDLTFIFKDLRHSVHRLHWVHTVPRAPTVYLMDILYISWIYVEFMGQSNGIFHCILYYGKILNKIIASRGE